MIHNYATHSEELEPCPFCGEKPIWYYQKTDKGNFIITIECLSCQVKMRVGTTHTTLEWATNQTKTKWNSRINKTKQPMEKIVQQSIYDDWWYDHKEETIKQKLVKMGNWALSHQWISVEDELPPVDEKCKKMSVDVFVRNEYGKVTSAWYSYSNQTWHLCYGEIQGDDLIYSKITHWMPIPTLEGGEE